jgi:hypothetical protein
MSTLSHQVIWICSLCFSCLKALLFSYFLLDSTIYNYLVYLFVLSLLPLNIIECHKVKDQVSLVLYLTIRAYHSTWFPVSAAQILA